MRKPNLYFSVPQLCPKGNSSPLLLEVRGNQGQSEEKREHRCIPLRVGWCSPTSGSLGPEETTGTLTGSQAKKAQAKPLFLGNLLIKESPHRTSCLAVFKLSFSQDSLVAHPNSTARAKTCLKHHLNPTASQFKNTPDRKPIRFENRQSKGEQSLIYSSAYNLNLAFSQRGSKMAMLI